MSEIRLNGNLTTTELRKPHPSRQVSGAEMSNGLAPHSCVVDKYSGGISQEQGDPIPYQPSPAHGSSARKISPHNFWLQKPVGIESVEENSGVPSSSP